MAIHGMVKRTGWDGKTWGAAERISVDDALHVFTINGADASHEESLKGSISEGKLADFVVLADDPHRASPDRIKDIRIARTVVGGETEYEA
jgi:predicted amidohydrolase YtcJ